MMCLILQVFQILLENRTCSAKSHLQLDSFAYSLADNGCSGVLLHTAPCMYVFSLQICDWTEDEREIF